jgi:hypothetical protein
MRRTVPTATLLLLTLLLACGGAEKAPVAWRQTYQPFSDRSPLRRPLPPDVSVHPKSVKMISDLYDTCKEAMTGPCKFPRLAGAPEDGRFFTLYGSPIYIGGANTKQRTVPCTLLPCGVQGLTGEQTVALFDVPIPEGARPDPSDDAHMIVYEPARGYVWEMFGASVNKTTGRWKTRGGMRWDLAGPGYDEIGEPGTAVGAGIPMFGTILRPEEVRAAMKDGTGVVPHVLSGGYDSPRIDCFIGPMAKTTDGDDGRTWAIPEGAILQLDPMLDVDKLELDPAAKVIARTLQRYGLVIRDDTGAFSIDVENVSVEDGAQPGRSALWDEVGLHKDSLAEIQGNMFRVVGWNPADAHGKNCL